MGDINTIIIRCERAIKLMEYKEKAFWPSTIKSLSLGTIFGGIAGFILVALTVKHIPIFTWVWNISLLVVGITAYLWARKRLAELESKHV